MAFYGSQPDDEDDADEDEWVCLYCGAPIEEDHERDCPKYTGPSGPMDGVL